MDRRGRGDRQAGDKAGMEEQWNGRVMVVTFVTLFISPLPASQLLHTFL